MKLKKARSGFQLLLIFVLLIFTGCGTPRTGSGSSASSVDSSSGSTRVGSSRPTLRVGIHSDFPPLIYREGRQIKGIEADLARSLTKELEMELKFVETKQENLISGLLRGDFDIIMSGMAFTPQRDFRVKFCNPYIRIGLSALVKRSDAYKFLSAQDVVLGDDTIGVERGTYGDFYIQSVSRSIKRVSYKSKKSAVKDLVKGKIDLFVHDSPVIRWLAAVYEDDGVIDSRIILNNNQYLAWAVHPESSQLLKRVNDTIAKWGKSGFLDAEFQRWGSVIPR
ncbi:MAG TPA: amino acid ABC transporter substrate-binding protein [Verrucomicrobiales bacterium]|nr:amino acid ABC transporter substrate-binding protein [Verrucomicrobiales bacterium]